MMKSAVGIVIYNVLFYKKKTSSTINLPFKIAEYNRIFHYTKKNTHWLTGNFFFVKSYRKSNWSQK